MDQDTLAENSTDDGRKLVDELPRKGFEVSAAFWIKASENCRWYFYVVSPMVEAEGLAIAYTQLHRLIRGMPQPFGIDPLEVKLIGPSNPIARDVLAIHRTIARPSATPTH